LIFSAPASGGAALSAIGGAGVPEPSAIILAIVGLVGVVFVRRRYK